MCQASDALRQAPPPPFDRAAWRSVLERRRPPRQTDASCRVVLLGTAGGGNPKSTRSGYANAVVVGDAVYLVDCGEGAHRQLWRAGLTVNPAYDPRRPVLRAVFLTHLHADHLMDLANLFVGSWPANSIEVFGPGPAGLPIPVFPPGTDRPLVYPDEPTPGTRSALDHLFRAFAYNTNLRIADEGRVDVTQSVRVHELGVRREGYVPDLDLGVRADASSDLAAAPPMEPVVIYPEDDHGVRVSAILVQHAPVFPAFGYRFDTPGGSVVFSGDTGQCANVTTLARGASVLVHEVIDIGLLTKRLTRLPNYESIRNHLASSHTAPEEVGPIADAAGVGTLVLSHLVPGDSELTEQEWEARVRPNARTEVLCGVDLDELALSR